MLTMAFLVVAANAGEPTASLPPEIAGYAQEASELLLAGETLPRDYRVRLMGMEPSVRLQALVFLRRAGLLTADPWPLEDILKPAIAAQEDVE